MTSHHRDTGSDAARESPGYLLWLMSNKWQAQQRSALQPFDLTHVQFVLLACLVYAPGNQSLTQIQLAERAETDPMMTSQVLRKLEARGRVRRMSNAHDRRSVRLAPTAKGIKLVHEAIEAVEAVDQEFFGTLGVDTPKFVTMMRQLVWTGRNTRNNPKQNSL